MRFKAALNRIFCLPGRWTALLAVPSFLLVALVLAQGREDALAYFAYLFSAYGLVVALTLTDVRFRTRVSLGAGLAVNLLYVAVNLVSGLRYHAAWFVVLALYYAFLAALRSIKGAVAKCTLCTNDSRLSETCGLKNLVLSKNFKPQVFYNLCIMRLLLQPLFISSQLLLCRPLCDNHQAYDDRRTDDLANGRHLAQKQQGEKYPVRFTLRLSTPLIE